MAEKAERCGLWKQRAIPSELSALKMVKFAFHFKCSGQVVGLEIVVVFFSPFFGNKPFYTKYSVLNFLGRQNQVQSSPGITWEHLGTPVLNKPNFRVKRLSSFILGVGCPVQA